MMPTSASVPATWPDGNDGSVSRTSWTDRAGRWAATTALVMVLAAPVTPSVATTTTAGNGERIRHQNAAAATTANSPVATGLAAFVTATATLVSHPWR